MAMFGALGRALSNPDSLAMIGATLRDVGASMNGEAGNNVLLTQKALQERQQKARLDAFRQKLGGLIGAQGPGGFMPQLPKSEDPQLTRTKSIPGVQGINPDGGPLVGQSAAGAGPLSIADPRLPALLMEAGAVGYDMGDLVDVMKANKSEYVNGVRVNPYDANGPGFIPTFDKGQEPLYNSRGQIVGVRNMDGSVQAAADMAGAVEGAKEGAKAGYDLVTVPQSDGTTVTMPRSQAVALLGGGAGGGAPALRPGGGSGAPRPQATPAGGPRLGVAQSPAAAAADKMTAEAGAKAGLDLPKLTDQANLTLGVLDQIRRHPSLGDRTGNSAYLPPLRPQDRDFDNLVGQIRGGAFLEAINSLRSTGQITEIEGKKATDALLRAQQTQSQEGFLKALADYEGVVKTGLTRAQRAAQGGGGHQPAPAAGQRQAGATYQTPRGPMKWTGTGWLPAN